jgi:hypothetical protein
VLLLAACSSTGRTSPEGCPLTGALPSADGVPDRPALAIKVDNAPVARPQTGLSWADIVYEEPVEGGLTRYIAVYHCRDASRVEPVRSARLMDPDVLAQFGEALFAYSGGVPKVVDKIGSSGLLDVSFTEAPEAYERDPGRDAPHNLMTDTRTLYAAAGDPGGPPVSQFSFGDAPPSGRKADRVHVPFSPSSDVVWRWSDDQKVYLRSYGDQPDTLSDGTQVSAVNVIIQVVRVTLSDIRDSNGVPSPFAHVVGEGTAHVLSGGRVAQGRWMRSSLDDPTTFVDAQGDEITLTPGATWIELVPSDTNVSVG